PSSGVITKILGSPGGLPSDHVLSVEVSPSGMLWAGTADRGVARIRPDGTFRRPLSSFDGLPSDRVQAVYTRGDSVWVATSGGVEGFFSGSAALGVYQYAPGAWQSTGAGLPTPRVGALRDGPDGALWAGTSGGAARLRPGSSAWEPHLSDGPLVNGTQRAVVDPRGVWFTTGNDFPAGIARGVVLHFDGVSWSALTSATTGGAFEQADAFGILSDATGRIWIGHCCANAEPR